MDPLLDREKDFSDFAFALRSLPQNIVEIHACGFLGGRRDHELANFRRSARLFEGAAEADAACDGTIRRGFTRGAPANGPSTWQGTFSLMALENGSRQLQSTGACKYPVGDFAYGVRLRCSSFGIEQHDRRGRVTVTAEGPLFCLLSR